MKKVILSALVVGALLATSCKKAKEGANAVVDGAEAVVDKGAEVVTDGANAVADGAGAVVDGVKEGANAVAEGAENLADKAGSAIKSAVAGVDIPEFEDPKVGEHLQAYSEYAKDYIAKGADAYKDAALVQKGADLLAKGKEIVGGLDAESAAKFNSVVKAIQSKMAPAN